MTKREIKVCIILPAYNEAPVISNVLKDLKNHLKKEKFTYKIIVVNDNSTDNTAVKARKAGAVVIDHLINTGGPGGPTLTGLHYAKRLGYDLAATLDSDGQHNPKDVINGIKLLQKTKTDLLIGNRLLGKHNMPKAKVIGNWGLSFGTWLLFGVKVTDSQSGLRIFSQKALDSLSWKSSGYDFCSEMLWRARQNGLKISEYPIAPIYTTYSKSRGQSNWNGINIVKSLIKRRIGELFE